MKLLFWSALVLGAIWYYMKKSQGGGNDLTAHLKEQRALQSIGDSALGANQVGQGNFPLSTFGDFSLTGINLDPLNPANPFTIPNNPVFGQEVPSNVNSNPFVFGFGNN